MVRGCGCHGFYLQRSSSWKIDYLVSGKCALFVGKRMVGFLSRWSLFSPSSVMTLFKTTIKNTSNSWCLPTERTKSPLLGIHVLLHLNKQIWLSFYKSNFIVTLYPWLSRWNTRYRKETTPWLCFRNWRSTQNVVPGQKCLLPSVA